MSWTIRGLDALAFKRLAKRLHDQLIQSSLPSPPKLADVQELLARSLGHPNAHGALAVLSASTGDPVAPPAAPPLSGLPQEKHPESPGNEGTPSAWAAETRDLIRVFSGRYPEKLWSLMSSDPRTFGVQVDAWWGQGGGATAEDAVALHQGAARLLDRLHIALHHPVTVLDAFVAAGAPTASLRTVVGQALMHAPLKDAATLERLVALGASAVPMTPEQHTAAKALLSREWDEHRHSSSLETLSTFRNRSNASLLLRRLLDGGADPNVPFRVTGEWPVHAFLDSEELHLLIRAGADLNVRDNFGCTPLGKLCLYARTWGSEAAKILKLSQLLLHHGADPNAPSHPDGSGPLAILLESRNRASPTAPTALALTELLVRHGATDAGSETAPVPGRPRARP